MTSKNDITGDKLATKPSSDAYRDNWDRIFGKKEKFSGPSHGAMTKFLVAKDARKRKIRGEALGVTSYPLAGKTDTEISEEIAVAVLSREKKIAGDNPANKTDLVSMVEGILLAPTIGTARLVDNEDEGDPCD